MMDVLKNINRAKNPHDGQSSLLSKYLLWYLNGIFSDGYKRTLEEKDILKISQEQSTEVVTKELEKIWENELKEKKRHGKNPSYFRCLLRLRFLDLLWIGIIYFFIEAISVVQCFCLYHLLTDFSKSGLRATNNVYFWTTGIAVSLFFHWLVLHPVLLHSERIGVSFNNAAIGLIYKKLLKIHQNALQLISSDRLMVLISVDAQKLQEGIRYINYIWITPLKFIAVLVILWREIGIPCLTMLGMVVVLLPFQIWLNKLVANIRSKTNIKTGGRMNVMSEIVNTIREIKMQVWENIFKDMVNHIRSRESSGVMKSTVLQALSDSIFTVNPYLASLATFSWFYYQGDGLSLPMAFLVLSLFFTTRWSVSLYFPLSIQMVRECRMACKRIENFLLLEELAFLDISSKTENSDHNVVFNDVTASFGKNAREMTVDRLSFKADQKNSLVMVIGPAESGKSSILKVILQELYIQTGDLQLNGTVAYVAQQPWIFSGTIRQNILFGREFDKTQYETVITACALGPDFDSFHHGDLSMVGGMGLSLNQSQKAKISLARAVYQDADIYLLDEPLSEVETEVGKHIFHKCIRGMLKKKIILLAMQHLRYVEFATDIICLKENFTTVQGSLLELSHQGIDLTMVVHPERKEKQWDHDSAIETEDHMHYTHLDDDVMVGHALSSVVLDMPRKDQHSRKTSSMFSVASFLTGVDEYEEVTTSNVSIGLYLKYLLDQLHCLSFIVFLFLLLGAQVATTLADCWLTKWSEEEGKATFNNSASAIFGIGNNPNTNLYIYAGIVFVATILILCRTIYYQVTMVRCGGKVHAAMFEAILKAPMQFFETNHSSRILKWFGHDVHHMDTVLPTVTFDYVQLITMALVVVTLNCVSVPYVAVVAVPALLVYAYSRHYFVKTYTQLKHLQASGHSPMYTHITSTLSGLSTIRSSNAGQVLINECFACQDYQAEFTFMSALASHWYSLRVDLLVTVFSILCLYAPAIVASHIDINVGLVGLSLTYLLAFNRNFKWYAPRSLEIGHYMASMGRALEYAKVDPEEVDHCCQDMRPSWPEYGLITAEGASFAYDKALPYVLKKLYFCIRPMEKVGIVGRIGAGKSSLLSMLFRMGSMSGKVMLDGIAITDLKLEDLRKNISVVTRNPVLMSGPLRRNLDPYQEFTDGDIWEALEDVHMKETVMELPYKLQTDLNKTGCHLNVGERQLLCLARALLRQNKLLVIDEATEDIPVDMNSLIQHTVRERFHGWTVVTIAHRLNTVMDLDRVMVLDNGRLVEFDEPFELLQNRSGYLRKLVDQAGRNEVSRLEVQADEARQLRHVMLLQQTATYPGSHITFSRTKEELMEHFGTKIIYETTL